MGRKLTYEFVKEYVESFGYILLTNYYENNNQILETICPNGHYYKTCFRKFREGRRCSECNKVSLKEILDFLGKINYKYINKEYKNGKLYVTFECSHNHIRTMYWQDIKRGKRCFDCCGSEKYTQEFVDIYIKKYGHKLLSIYESANKDINILCDEGHIYTTTFNQFKNGNRRCDKCHGSSGEKAIQIYLNKFLKENIDYFHNKEYFKDLFSMNGKLLRPDFILPQYKIWIEFDGQQHFEPVDFANKGKEWAEENFKKVKYNDQLKNEYAKNNGWKLIRIPYTEFDNIEIILDKELK